MSANLAFPQLTGSENNKHIKINEALAAIDSVLSEVKTITFESADANAITISDEDWQTYNAFMIEDNVVVETPENIITCPNIKKGLTTFYNNSNNTLRITTATHTGDPRPEIQHGQTLTVWNDGTNIRTVGGSEFIQTAFLDGPATSSLVWAMQMPFTVWLLANTGTSPVATRSRTTCVAFANTAPSSAFSLTLKKNGTTIGTIDFATSGLGTVDITTDWGFAYDDTLEIHTPSNLQGADLIAVTFIGVR